MNRLLLTCPTRNRPDRLKDMLISFNITKSLGTDIAICIDDDDPRINEYLPIVNGSRVWIKPRISVAQIHNMLVRENPGYDFYMPVNDDIIFKTPGWDKKLMDTINDVGDGWGIAYGDDCTGNHRHNLPTFGMVSSSIVKTLGYIYPPELLALFGDTFLLDIGRAIGRLFYCPDVVIEHKRVIDDPNDPRSTVFFEKREREAYANYIDKRLDTDIAKIFDAMCQGATRE